MCNLFLVTFYLPNLSKLLFRLPKLLLHFNWLLGIKVPNLLESYGIMSILRVSFHGGRSPTTLNIVFSVTNSNSHGSILIVKPNVVSPPLNVNLTLFFIPWKKIKLNRGSTCLHVINIVTYWVGFHSNFNHAWLYLISNLLGCKFY